MTELEKNQYLEAKERVIVLKTCYEIGLLVEPYSFYDLFGHELNNLACLGVKYNDFKRISTEVLKKLNDEELSNDEFFLKYELLFKTLEQIAHTVKTEDFFNEFGKELNYLAPIGISDDKYMDLSDRVKASRSLIELERSELPTDRSKEYQYTLTR